LKQGATVELSAGTYSFEQIDAALRATFNLDVRQGPIHLNVLGNVSAGQEVKFVPQTAAGDVAALKILLQCEGSRVSLDRKTEFVGTILAPEGVIDIGQQVKVQGALYGRRAQVSANSIVAGPPAVSLLIGASTAWLGYKNDCEATTAAPPGTPDPLARLIGQAIYGCQQVDLGTAVMIAHPRIPRLDLLMSLVWKFPQSSKRGCGHPRPYRIVWSITADAPGGVLSLNRRFSSFGNGKTPAVAAARPRDNPPAIIRSATRPGLDVGSDLERVERAPSFPFIPLIRKTPRQADSLGWCLAV